MRDFLETIAQQIDKVAEKPFDAAIFVGGGFAMWQWVGWWGVLALAIFMVATHLLVDGILYLRTKRTFAKHGDTKLWLKGFHPFHARAMARRFDRALKERGEESVVAELALLGAYITHDGEYIGPEIAFEIWQAPFDQTGLSEFTGGYDENASYECVWRTTVPAADEPDRILSIAFSIFQRIDEGHMPPEGYTGRSLSMGDLVRLGDHWYYCAAVGWEEVSAPKEAGADRV